MEMKKRKTLLGILAIVGVLSITIGVSVAFLLQDKQKPLV